MKKRVLSAVLSLLLVFSMIPSALAEDAAQETVSPQASEEPAATETPLPTEEPPSEPAPEPSQTPELTPEPAATPAPGLTKGSENIAVTLETILFADGDGSEADPYGISTPEQLDAVRLYPSSHFILLNDIDLTAATSEGGVFWNSGAGWAPIVTPDNQPFTGIFDGNGYRITGLKSRQGGLFKNLGSGSEVFDLGIANVNIDLGTSGAAGIIAVQNLGSIRRCYTTGKVNAWQSAGLCNSSANGGSISDCFSTANVTGEYKYGLANGNLINCYTLEQNCESGTSAGNCYRMGFSNTEFSDLFTDNFTVLSEVQFRQQGSFTGFNFSNVWTMGGDPDYPYPELVGAGYIEKSENTVDFAGGNGLPHNPYKISNEQQLNNLRNYTGENFILDCDIDLKDETSAGGVFYNNGSGWKPIWFEGVLDGNSHTISGVNTSSTTGYAGLLSRVSMSNIFDLNITGISVNGGTYSAGGLAGSIMASGIENCSVDGSVRGGNEVGILAGSINGRATGGYVFVFNCHTSGIAYGIERVGGLAGLATDSSNIDKCSSNAFVRGNNRVGGLFGQLSAYASYDTRLSNCFTNGTVFGTTYYGGFAGFVSYDANDSVNCFWYDKNQTAATGAGGQIAASKIQFPVLDTIQISQHIAASSITTNMILPSAPLSIELTGTGDGSIARIENGELTGVSLGKTSVKLRLNYPHGSCYIDYAINVTGDPVTAVPVTGISFVNATEDLLQYQIVPISYIITPASATNRNIIWTSSNESIVKADNLGNILTLNCGIATVTATTEDGGFSAQCTVYVTNNGVHVTGVNITSGNSYRWPGEFTIYEATVIPSNASIRGIKWSSNDTSVATINASTGIAKAIAPGTATITVTTDDGGFTDTATITVLQHVTGVEVLPEAMTIHAGEVYTLSVNVLPANAYNKSVSYSSSNSNYVRIDPNNKITGSSPGTATITVKTSDGNYTDTCIVTVVPQGVVINPVTSVTINSHSETLVNHDSLTLTAAVLPEDATNKLVTWSSSDNTVATVDQTGKVTATGIGTAVIKALAEGKTDTCNIIVNPKPVASVTLSSHSETMTHHETLTLTAAVLPADASYPEVTWSSNNETAATVDQSGNVTAAGVGEAVITATADGISDTCNITVEPKRVTGVTLSSENKTIGKGGTFTLSAVVLPADATYPEVTWSSSNESIATVDQTGKVNAAEQGTIIITASADGVSDTCEITVWPLRDPCLTGLSLDHGFLEGGFDVKNLEYTVNVGPDIASLALTPAISDDSGTIKINGETAANGSPYSVSLNWGKNIVSISVVSQDETVENSYTVCVYRHTGIWKNVGQTICPADSLSYPRITVNKGVPYALINAEGLIYKYTGTSWYKYPAIRPGSWAEDINLKFYNNTMYVGFLDVQLNKTEGYATVKKYDGTKWVQLGHINIDTVVSNLAMTVYKGVPYVAYVEKGKVYIKKYTGTSWVYAGDPFAPDTIGNVTIKFDDSTGLPYVIYTPNIDGYIKTMVARFNGTEWETLGSVLPLSDSPKLAVSGGQVYVWVSDKVYKYDGSDWQDTGNVILTNKHFDLEAENGTPYYVYLDTQNGNKLTVRKYNGSEWVNVGTGSFDGRQPSLAIENGVPYIIYTVYVGPGFKTYAAKYVQDKISAPVISSVASNSYNSIKITWRSVTGATGYEVYRCRTYNGNYTFAGDTDETSYLDKGLEKGKTYYYKIKAYHGDSGDRAFSLYSGYKYAKPSWPAISLKAAPNSYTSIKLTWNAIAGAAYYKIYRGTSYRDINDCICERIEGTGTITYIDSEIYQTSKKYYYRIKACDDSVTPEESSPYCSYKYATPEWPKINLKAISNSCNSIRLTWNEIYGAKGYEIYRSTSYRGPFEEPIYTVDNGHIISYTDINGGIGLTAGKTYYYEVRAYDITENGMKRSPYSSCKYAKPVPSVTAIRLQRTSPTSINISWGEVAGAAGYEIFRATSPGGTYTRIKTTSGLSYENTGLYAYITYYYQVRAYCNDGSAAVYGPYSEEKHLWF